MKFVFLLKYQSILFLGVHVQLATTEQWITQSRGAQPLIEYDIQ